MGQATPIWVRFCAKIIYTKTLRFYELKKEKNGNTISNKLYSTD